MHAEHKWIDTRARCLLCLKNHKKSEHRCRQPGCKAAAGVHCRSIVVRYSNCKGAHKTTSNKWKAARETTAKGRKTGDSRVHRNLDRIENREEGPVGSSKIEGSLREKDKIYFLADIDSWLLLFSRTRRRTW